MYMDTYMTDRAYDIMSELEDKIQEVFLKKQEELGISSGDISPMVNYDLTCALEKLSQIIDYALTEQENG